MVVSMAILESCGQSSHLLTDQSLAQRAGEAEWHRHVCEAPSEEAGWKEREGERCCLGSYS